MVRRSKDLNSSGIVEKNKARAITNSNIWQAARKAHVDLQVLRPADLITEPEAAALYVFHAFSSKAGFKV